MFFLALSDDRVNRLEAIHFTITACLHAAIFAKFDIAQSVGRALYRHVKLAVLVQL
jgi:hypothetical protein